MVRQLTVMMVSVALLVGCGGPGGDDGGSGGGSGAAGGSAGGSAGGGSGGGAASSCSNGVTVGESICPNGGNTLKLCTNRNGALFGKEVACSGTRPSCAAEIVNGVPYAACCPAGNVGNPHDSACSQ